MKMMIGVVVLVVLVAISVGITRSIDVAAPHTQVEQWADAVSRGDYSAMEPLMHEPGMNFFYPMWRDQTERYVRTGQMRPARIAVEQPRGQSVFYCVEFGSPVAYHLDVSVNEQGLISVLSPYGRGRCPGSQPSDPQPAGDQDV
jgi:hypothetical protein